MTEPIRKITLRDGATRYRVTVDVGVRRMADEINEPRPSGLEKTPESG